MLLVRKFSGGGALIIRNSPFTFFPRRRPPRIYLYIRKWSLLSYKRPSCRVFIYRRVTPGCGAGERLEKVFRQKKKSLLINHTAGLNQAGMNNDGALVAVYRERPATPSRWLKCRQKASAKDQHERFMQFWPAVSCWSTHQQGLFFFFSLLLLFFFIEPLPTYISQRGDPLTARRARYIFICTRPIFMDLKTMERGDGASPSRSYVAPAAAVNGWRSVWFRLADSSQ